MRAMAGAVSVGSDNNHGNVNSNSSNKKGKSKENSKEPVDGEAKVRV